jgi:hypothetical protein
MEVLSTLSKCERTHDVQKGGGIYAPPPAEDVKPKAIVRSYSWSQALCAWRAGDTSHGYSIPFGKPYLA